MFVGEIGIGYGRFLYGLVWWEVKSIIRGYNARHHAGWEQARFVAYNAHFAMGSKDPIPNVKDWIPFPWEKKQVTQLTDDEVLDLQAEMAAYNATIENSKDQKQ